MLLLELLLVLQWLCGPSRNSWVQSLLSTVAPFASCLLLHLLLLVQPCTAATQEQAQCCAQLLSHATQVCHELRSRRKVGVIWCQQSE